MVCQEEIGKQISLKNVSGKRKLVQNQKASSYLSPKAPPYLQISEPVRNLKEASQFTLEAARGDPGTVCWAK